MGPFWPSGGGLAACVITSTCSGTYKLLYRNSGDFDWQGKVQTASSGYAMASIPTRIPFNPQTLSTLRIETDPRPQWMLKTISQLACSHSITAPAANYRRRFTSTQPNTSAPC
jgi:hypothetical protein